MNLAALTVVNTFNEIFIAYGQSDEYSFVFKKDAKVYKRRGDKILTCKKGINYFINFNCIRSRLFFHLCICFLLEQNIH